MESESKQWKSNPGSVKLPKRSMSPREVRVRSPSAQGEFREKEKCLLAETRGGGYKEKLWFCADCAIEDLIPSQSILVV